MVKMIKMNNKTYSNTSITTTIKLIPQCQYKLCSYKDSVCKLCVDVIVNDIVVGGFSGNYDYVLNVKNLRARFGYDKIPDIPLSEFKEIKLNFDEMLKEVKTKVIYLYQGWNKDLSYYILDKYKIGVNDVSEVINGMAESQFKLSTQPDNGTLSNHMMSRYFKVLKHRLYPKILLCVSLLAMFTTQLQQTDNQPQFSIFIKGRFNRGKSSSVKALINPWNGQTFSFEDTEAVLKQALKLYRDVLLIIDDMSKSKRPGMMSKNERIIRLAGDTTTSAQKMMGGKIDNSNVTCMPLITGEDIPQLQNSSYTRMLILSYDDDEVDWDILTELQENTSLTTWFYIKFLQFSMSTDDFTEELLKLFAKYRAKYREKFKKYDISNRYVDICAWILAMWTKVREFFASMGKQVDESSFVMDFEKLMMKTGMKYSQKSSSQLFLMALFNLIENNRLNIVSFAEAKDGAVFDIFEKDGIYFIKSGVVFDKVKGYCDSLNIDFYESERSIRKELDSYGLIQKFRDYTTTEFKDRNNRGVSGFYLLKNNAQEIIKDKEGIFYEDI